MTNEEVQKRGDGVYWIRMPGKPWDICRTTNLQMDGYGNVLHILRPGDTWLIPAPNDSEFVGPIKKPS